MAKIIVQNKGITVSANALDYISLTDMANAKERKPCSRYNKELVAQPIYT